MTTTELDFRDLKLKAHPGYISYRSGYTTDGTDDITMNVRFYGLAANILDAKCVIKNALNGIVAEVIAGSGADLEGKLTVPVTIPATNIPNTQSADFGTWHVNVTFLVQRIAGNIWEWDGGYPFGVTFLTTSPPPPPPPPPPGCTDCGPGTHCENGICVADPPPPPPPNWLEKLKALFPAQLQQYAVPIAMGVAVLAYQGFKKK